jgi:hypothetical protein
MPVNNSRENEKKNSLTNMSKTSLQFACPTAAGRGSEIAHSCVMGKEGSMFIVKVAWDARNQQFRLVDQKLAHVFEEGDTYLLVVDFYPQESVDDTQFIDLDQAEMGHA